MSETATLDDVLEKLAWEGQISLLEIDTPGHEWTILGHLLDSGVMKVCVKNNILIQSSSSHVWCKWIVFTVFTLQNVTQVVTVLQIPDDNHGRHPTILRSRYSEMRRLEAYGFSIFHSNPVPDVNLNTLKRRNLGENCCFKLGFIHKEDMLL